MKLYILINIYLWSLSMIARFGQDLCKDICHHLSIYPTKKHTQKN